MNEDLIKLVEEKIKNCEDTKEAAEMLIAGHKLHIKEAERDLFKAKNVQVCLEGALKNLKDAQDREEDIATIRPIQDEETPADYLGPLKLAEKQGELIEEEREKKNKDLLNKADKQMAAAKKDQRADWKKCPVCLVRPIAPWNTKGKCSYCQTYKKKKKEEDLPS